MSQCACRAQCDTDEYATDRAAAGPAARSGTGAAGPSRAAWDPKAGRGRIDAGCMRDDIASTRVESRISGALGTPCRTYPEEVRFHPS